jgi:hypothetical protein
MNKKIFILIIVAVVLQGLGMLFKVMDKMYGETIPTIVYQQNHVFNKLVYNNNINGKKVSIYASYPDDIDKNISTVLILDFIEKSIIDNWKPYLKKDNEVVIELKINVDGSKEYKFLGNTGIYAAANSARIASLSPTLIGDNVLINADSIILVYKFTVSN